MSTQMKYTTIRISRKVKEYFEHKEKSFAYYLRKALKDAIDKNNIDENSLIDESSLYSTTCYLPEHTVRKIKHLAVDKEITMSKYIRIALRNYISEMGENIC